MTLVVHGLLHLLGAAKGIGVTEVSQLRDPISTGMGWTWLAAGAGVVLTGVLLAVGHRWWWAYGAVAAVASQTMIVSSWSDARAGTAVNVILVGAVVHGFAAQGPTSYRAEYHRRVRSTLGDDRDRSTSDSTVREADLTHLPAPVAAYVRQSGAVGQPRVRNFRARLHGRIRGGVDKPWMVFTGEQVNTYGADLTRLFLLDATMLGLPVDVFHSYVGPSATMRVKLASLVPIVRASGPDMDRAETVTLFNDLCIFAPAALVDARITWQRFDGHHALGTFTHAAHTVSAELIFNDQHELVDFISEDRLRAAPEGTTFTQQRWSTPVWDTRAFGPRRLCARGEAHWHPPGPEAEFSYLDITIDDVTYNVDATSATRSRA